MNQPMSKRREMIRQPNTTGHQHKSTVPDRLELRARHEHGPRQRRLLDKNLILAGLAEEQKAAVAQDRDTRQRRGRHPLPFRVIDACFQPELLRAAQHFGDANVVAEMVANSARNRPRHHASAGAAREPQGRIRPKPVGSFTNTPVAPPTRKPSLGRYPTLSRRNVPASCMMGTRQYRLRPQLPVLGHRHAAIALVRRDKA